MKKLLSVLFVLLILCGCDYSAATSTSEHKVETIQTTTANTDSASFSLDFLDYHGVYGYVDRLSFDDFLSTYAYPLFDLGISSKEDLDLDGFFNPSDISKDDLDVCDIILYQSQIFPDELVYFLNLVTYSEENLKNSMDGVSLLFPLKMVKKAVTRDNLPFFMIKAQGDKLKISYDVSINNWNGFLYEDKIFVCSEEGILVFRLR